MRTNLANDGVEFFDFDTEIINDITTNRVPYNNGTKLVNSNIYYSGTNI
jgi:hypothetical protein